VCGEVDGAVDDGAAGAQLGGFVVDREHRLLAALGQDGCERPKTGGTGNLAGLLIQRDRSVLWSAD
jgi:hypothetical protein